jgi:MAC/Perforin domain
MANKLITVAKSGQVSKSLMLDPASMLSAVRTTLVTAGYMDADDLFLNQGSEIDQHNEDSISLDDLLNGTTTINIGAGTAVDPIGTDDGVQHYNELSAAQKKSIFANIAIYKGLTLKTTGFQPTFHSLYKWKDGKFPAVINPRIVTQVDYSYAFSKLVQTMDENSVDKGSVSLEVPFLEASAEFSYEKTKHTSSEKTTEYITGKYMVRKVMAQVDAADIVADPAFEKAVHDAIASSTNEFEQYYELLTVLNEWGYYIPLEFTLGGALFSSDSTTITEFSEAESQKQEFGGSFKAKFDGIGGGGSYSHAEGSSQSTTQSNKFQITSFSQVGGRAGTSDSYSDWAKSLDKALYWNVAAYDKLYPSLGLLQDAQLQNVCIHLMDTYGGYPHAVELQPFLNMKNYATAVQNLYANPWGG